ncbi:hypothetical protein [Foetidibacter luteolus]|uniref:hypothetical protein n=1 Tax=Foetidibacter luteolus TaxID=2608880 RepID=UPI00129A64F9|nr:hypothetical protein [Foetidibacter luteolus]
MDAIISLLLTLQPLLNGVAAIAVIIKILYVFNVRGFDVPVLMLSFFRIYHRRGHSSSRKRQEYMLVNNCINIYLYFWLFVTAVLFIIQGR